jgi:hypothetical protein
LLVYHRSLSFSVFCFLSCLLFVVVVVVVVVTRKSLDNTPAFHTTRTTAIAIAIVLLNKSRDHPTTRPSRVRQKRSLHSLYTPSKGGLKHRLPKTGVIDLVCRIK